MFHVSKAESSQANIIHDLVHQIYHPTYKDILSLDQIEFMLDKSYTLPMLQQAMATDQDFYLLTDNAGCFVGFMAVKDASDFILRIEKLYLLPSTQGKGAGKFLISFASELAKAKEKSVLELNVNRANSAYYFYLKQGFVVTQEIDIPYFGYILDDYIMQKYI